MATSNNTGSNVPSFILRGTVVPLERINMDNAAVDRCRQSNYKITYKYAESTLPYCFDVSEFCEAEKNNEKEVAILQNAVKCLRAMFDDTVDPSILDEYADDTLLTFDFVTGKNIFDEETFKKDSEEYKTKLRALIAEYNKIVAASTLLNAIENAKKLQEIKGKIDELRTTEPKKEDAKYNHPEIVQGTTSVKQALDRYKELCELRNKCKQEWEQYEIDYKRSRAKKLNISEDSFRIFKDLYNDGIYFSGNSDKLIGAVARYESVKDYNENSWKEVKFDDRNESRKFLSLKQLKLWQKYGKYTKSHSGPYVEDWMMYEQFNDNDLTWLTALKAFYERVMALKRIEEQSK